METEDETQEEGESLNMSMAIGLLGKVSFLTSADFFLSYIPCNIFIHYGKMAGCKWKCIPH